MKFKSLPIGATFTLNNTVNKWTYTKTATNFATFTGWGEELKQWFAPIQNSGSMYSQDTEVNV